MKLCDICLKTFRDNYALKRHQLSKVCKSISISTPTPANTQKTILLNKDYTFNNNNNNKTITIDNNNSHNNSHNSKIITIDNKYTINKKEKEDDKNCKKVIISSKKIKCDEMITTTKTNNKTVHKQQGNSLSDANYNFTLEIKIVKKGDIFNCSLCQTEFKYRNNFYRHKKKCPILFKSL